MDFQWSVIIESLPPLVQGAKLTLYITVMGLIGGMIIGFLLGLMRAYGNPLLHLIASVYIELVRGTPIVVQVMFIYFALPVLIGVRVDPLAAAIASIDRKSTRLNSSHVATSYAVFCLK